VLGRRLGGDARLELVEGLAEPLQLGF